MSTARIYKTHTVLVDPLTGREFPVLLPRALGLDEVSLQEPIPTQTTSETLVAALAVVVPTG